MIRLAVLLLLLGLPAPAAAESLELLVDWMSGSFSSAAQAESDEDFRDIRLEMARIWPDRNDGVWMYVEQATAEGRDRPYRQRVYHVTDAGDGRFVSAVYTFESPLRFAGAWNQAEPLATLTPDSLAERDGCVVHLAWSDGAFSGATDGRACASNLRGAVWASSVVEIREDRIVSWDRGFDAAGNQVWGSEKGGYVFLRQ